MNIRSERAFLLYSCFAWAMPLALTGVTYLADNVVNNEEWQPRVGDEGHCWIYSGFCFVSGLWYQLTNVFLSTLS